MARRRRPCTHHLYELKYANEHRIPIIPIKLCESWPPAPPPDHDGGSHGKMQNNYLFGPSLVYLDWSQRAWDVAECAQQIVKALQDQSLLDVCTGAQPSQPPQQQPAVLPAQPDAVCTVADGPWAAFEPHLPDAPEVPDAATGDKILADAKYFNFGSTDEFRHGLRGRLRRSMRQEFEENEGDKWLAEYIYVVCHAAIAVPDVPKEHPDRLAAIAKYEAIGVKAIGKRRTDPVSLGTPRGLRRPREPNQTGLHAARSDGTHRQPSSAPWPFPCAVGRPAIICSLALPMRCWTAGDHLLPGSSHALLNGLRFPIV
jgi:hypothetical protein